MTSIGFNRQLSTGSAGGEDGAFGGVAGGGLRPAPDIRGSQELIANVFNLPTYPISGAIDWLSSAKSGTMEKCVRY